MLSVRNAADRDYDRIMEIYRYAQDYMIRSGNPDQWGHFYPEPELVREDIRQGVCKVLFDEDGIHGVFALFEGEEPTYKHIEDGEWLNDEPYVTIHRIAGDGLAHGMLRCAVDYCKGISSNVRIDTHGDNHVMQRQIEKNGFKKCGTIYVADGSPRIAYHYRRTAMAKKTIILNGSPRKNWNTAMMLREAQRGAESVGAETEYIDLYDLNYVGCRSCMACKIKDAARCKCFWKDELSPVIDRIFSADALIIGSPNYLGNITSQVYALMERLHFCSLSYDDYSNYFQGKVNVGVILTMNAGKDIYEKWYKESMAGQLESLKALNGAMEIYPCCDTLQVKDYSRYSMSGFDEDHKKRMREEQFPRDLKEAFSLGARLSK